MSADLYKSFYDGGGKDDTAAVSLCGVAAPESRWEQFDLDWGKALEKHGAQCLHMCDAIALKKKFSTMNGWDGRKVELLIGDLVKVLYDHMNLGLQFRSCTVLRKEYIRAKREHPTLRPLAAICANFCVGGLIVPKEHEVILHFDRNEQFLKQVYRVWCHLRNKRKRPAWVRRTRNILKVDSSYPSIQAADFVAWSLSRAQSRGDYQHWSNAATLLGESQLYDYDAIVERYANDKWS